MWTDGVQFAFDRLCIDMDGVFGRYMRVYAYLLRNICVDMDVKNREQGLQSAEMFHVEHIHSVEFTSMFTT